jgi:hypothetical protein
MVFQGQYVRVVVPCFLVFRWRGSMGRERSARVSAVGRRENLVLDALQGAAVTRDLASDTQSIARKRAPGARF